MRSRPLVCKAFFGLISLSLVAPKIELIGFMHRMRWMRFELMKAVAVSVQDLALAGIVFCVLGVVLRRATVLRLLLCGAGTTIVLCLLLVDVRARELWLTTAESITGDVIEVRRHSSIWATSHRTRWPSWL